ncbi:DNA-3-methyladenine glycosylase family protein [Herbiconiux solani]|uniref:DNA-3-methyladenine glycosylase family protein n=1 Tax=Herbiconiux solani TaxID=661329 RepID=UPI000824814A|nr:DNA-3-methyladenine glycosylase [Herbiconiux solani]
MVDVRELAAAAPRGSFALQPRGPYSLAESIRFLEGFEPAAYSAGPAEAGQTLDAVFALEGSWLTVGISVEQVGTEVRGRIVAARPLKRLELSAARQQVERILSLDVDATGYAAIGETDPVIGGLQERYPGLRPVGFWSWYEAAAWSIISQRIRTGQAAALKARLADELGVGVLINGTKRSAFPAPAVLAQLSSFKGLTPQKVDWLRSLGEIARRNTIDSARLRRMPRADALEFLQTLPGVGPFSAELILLRGAGDPDAAPLGEKRFAEAVAVAYDLDAPPAPDELEVLSEGWAPYRTWVTVLLRRAAADGSADVDAAPAAADGAARAAPAGLADAAAGGDADAAPEEDASATDAENEDEDSGTVTTVTEPDVAASPDAFADAEATAVEASPPRRRALFGLRRKA